jgi:ABC-type nickel/cobalt efflux system permease component RcnA
MDNWTAIYSAIISLQRDISFALSGDIRQLAETGTLAPSLIALALALGAVHALTPGHGKSIILAYFVGHSARAIDGLIMAGKVAFSHSFTAIVLGDFGSRRLEMGKAQRRRQNVADDQLWPDCRHRTVLSL